MANEKRLINAYELREILDADECIWFGSLAYFPNWQINACIASCPTVDAVPVVRCKDCKHWLKDVAGCTDAVGRCEFANYMVGAAGYCVYGEKRTDETG